MSMIGLLKDLRQLIWIWPLVKKKKEIKAKATVLFDKSLKINNHYQSQKIP